MVQQMYATVILMVSCFLPVQPLPESIHTTGLDLAPH